MSDTGKYMQEMGIQARAAAARLRLVSADLRSRAIAAAAHAVLAAKADILKANASDMEAAREKGLAVSFLDRLFLDQDRLAAIAHTLRAIAAQDDPLGKELERWQQPNGLIFRKTTVPLGVIGIIFESRPNVTADAAALCVRSGNAAILRGGSDSLRSSLAINAALQSGFSSAGLPDNAVQVVPTADRAAVGEMLAGLNGALDLVIPRGGKSLVERVQREARVPVLSHLEGICHVYVHGSAHIDKARKIVRNAKMRRTGICGAAECLLIDQAASGLLPGIASDLLQAGCELRGDAAACQIVPEMNLASEDDWGREFLAPILAVKVMPDMDAAMDHIARYGSGHTESIIAEEVNAARRFQAQVDSAIVLHNASTQFADGGEFGFGAEIGIATGKLHVRGPVGAKHLTSFKYEVDGDGQVRP